MVRLQIPVIPDPRKKPMLSLVGYVVVVICMVVIANLKILFVQAPPILLPRREERLTDATVS